jgi:hypothetical protein
LIKINMINESSIESRKLSDLCSIELEGAPPIPDFIGRAKELGCISNLFYPGKALNISGPIGIGKTYLVSKFVQDILTPSCRTLWYTANGANDFWRFVWIYLISNVKENRKIAISEINQIQEDNNTKSLSNTMDIVLRGMEIDEDLLIVVDNYPINEKDYFHFLIKEAVNSSKIKTRFILISRNPVTYIQNNLRFPLGGLNKSDLSIVLQKGIDLELDMSEIDMLYNLSEGNPLMVNFIINSVSSQNSEKPLTETLKVVHFMPEIQDMYYARLKKLSSREKNLLSILLHRSKYSARITFYLYKIFAKKYLEGLIQKGIVYEDKGKYCIPKICGDYYSSIINL